MPRAGQQQAATVGNTWLSGSYTLFVRSPCRERRVWTRLRQRCQKHTRKENQNNTPKQMCLPGFASRPLSFGDGTGRQVAYMRILAYVYVYIYFFFFRV